MSPIYVLDRNFGLGIAKYVKLTRLFWYLMAFRMRCYTIKVNLKLSTSVAKSICKMYFRLHFQHVSIKRIWQLLVFLSKVVIFSDGRDLENRVTIVWLIQGTSSQFASHTNRFSFKRNSQNNLYWILFWTIAWSRGPSIPAHNNLVWNKNRLGVAIPLTNVRHILIFVQLVSNLILIQGTVFSLVNILMTVYKLQYTCPSQGILIN